MKAKDYADKYISSKNKNKAIVEIAKAFWTEIEITSNARNIKLDMALIPILKELNKKWMKFAGIVNKKYPVSEPIKYTAFKELVQDVSPELYAHWVINSK